MFGLIPMVITIILAAIVAGAFAYFGGDIYSDSSVSAKANGFVNEGSQVRSAAQLYRVKEAAWPADVATLVTESYLGGQPSHSYTIDGANKGQVNATSAANADLTAAVCNKVQEASTGSEALITSVPAGQLFGCTTVTTAATSTTPESTDHTFFHK